MAASLKKNVVLTWPSGISCLIGERQAHNRYIFIFVRSFHSLLGGWRAGWLDILTLLLLSAL